MHTHRCTQSSSIALVDLEHRVFPICRVLARSRFAMVRLRMRRGIHIAVTLFAVVAVIAPLDCFTNGVRTREAAACCLKGDCHPGANADDCCKNTLPDTSRLMPPTATNQHFPLVVSIVVDTSTLVSTPVFQRLTNELRHPPPTPSLATVNLPLLV
jgi:hypothetical protein